ncbi:hypothetical protein [Oscillibacter sp.]|uniref:hypothetical protein n=1 Tax=Oscillibacter sp. TaxID=1945593 RepID=UPI0028AAA8C3|nr:hypothetical protein [Oscillibacter sp.]MDD3230707.1 hypothetical protein [Oscillospiraceae bacterium]MEA4932141.1 hypothetical protein [Lawsonibacter sp.]
MKVRVNHILALLCVFALSIGLSIPAGAANMNGVVGPQASDQLAYYTAYAVTSSGGKVIIEFEVDGTRRMDVIGASYIVVQEKTGDKWMGVSTYFGSVANGMLDNNTFSHMGSITYKGTPGKEYRALATVYAENSSGDDSRTIITNSVTAK